MKANLKMKGRTTMSNLTYREVNGMMVPELYLPPMPEGDLGRFGRARLKFLQEQKLLLHQQLLTSGKLKEHLLEIQQTATARMELLIAEMAQAQGLTEELKAQDQMQWLGLMNNIRHRAEESVMRELVYN